MPDLKIAGYEIHPAAEMLPLLDDAGLAELAADIKANGLRIQIVRYEGKILDGRNRLIACERAGVRPQFVDWTGPGSAILWVMSVNFHRRHLTPSQKAMVAAKAKGLLDVEAAGRMRAGTLASRDARVGKSAEIAAKAAGVSAPTVERATAVLRTGATELVHAVEAGKISVNTAAHLSSAPREEQKAILQLSEKEIIQKAREINAKKKAARLEERTEKLAHIAKGNEPLPAGQTARLYPIIYADPPWEYRPGTTDPSREIANQYPPMPLEEICALKVAELATPDAILFMWATNPLLPEAFEVLKAWGFTYKTNIAWDKEYGEMGWWVRGRHELLLIATKGNPPTPPTAERPTSVQHIRKDSEHSRKPDEFYALIERAYPTLPKLELFARHAPANWSQWGNQARQEARSAP